MAEDKGTVVSQFDELAYTGEIRRQLIAHQPVADAELETLARHRAENLQAAVLASNENLVGRVSILGIDSVSRDADEMIKMKVALSAGELDSNQQESNPS